MTIVENYFPFDSGDGSGATETRWRLMARLWYGSGIVPNYLNSMAPSLAGSVVTVAPGAVWLDGFYGESSTSKPFTISGSGLIVAHMDPASNQITIAWAPGVTGPTQTPTGIYEVAIARITSGAMVDIRQFASPGIPSGVMWEFGGGTPPLGWLLCDGTSYLRTDYPALFTAIGTTHGAADGSHFSVPDYRGRAGIGAGAGTGLTNRLLGVKVGEENHILTLGELASHGHSHSHGGNSGGQSVNHTHNSALGSGFAATGIGTFGPVAGGSPTVSGPMNSPGTSGANVGHAHGIGVDATAVGSGTGHNNLQPSIVITKIIKT
jgi:microcystin-dependent protein